jgi:tRNA-splicing ligase RtcB (3'-phosphate/5'-hydroxy nucleic acid ligase)
MNFCMPGLTSVGTGSDFAGTSRGASCSASHGAGRVMSRTKALHSFTCSATRKLLAERCVELLSAGSMKYRGVYKDIRLVMSAQTDLVEVLGRLDPKLAKICPSGRPR